MFAAEIIADAELDRRADARGAVDFSSRITTDNEWRAACRVADLSRNGARLTVYSPLAIGTTIWIRLPGIDQRAATVKWVDGLTAGCAFHDPLSESDMTALVAAHGFAPSDDHAL
jgi:hypothetical protein